MDSKSGWEMASPFNTFELGGTPHLSFLDASTHLYNRVCPSVRLSVRPSVRPSETLFLSGQKQ